MKTKQNNFRQLWTHGKDSVKLLLDYPQLNILASRWTRFICTYSSVNVAQASWIPSAFWREFRVCFQKKLFIPFLENFWNWKEIVSQYPGGRSIEEENPHLAILITKAVIPFLISSVKMRSGPVFLRNFTLSTSMPTRLNFDIGNVHWPLSSLDLLV